MGRKEDQPFEFEPEFKRETPNILEFVSTDRRLAGKLEIDHSAMATLSIADRRALEGLFSGFSFLIGNMIENKQQLNAAGARIADCVALVLHHTTEAATKLDQAIENGTKRIEEGREL